MGDAIGVRIGVIGGSLLVVEIPNAARSRVVQGAVSVVGDRNPCQSLPAIELRHGDLDRVITDTAELANRFNSDFADEAGPVLQIDLAAVRQSAGESPTQPLACLIDLAKAEALT